MAELTSKNLDSLKFSEVKSLLNRIAAVLNFKVICRNAIFDNDWRLAPTTNDSIDVYLDGCYCMYSTAKNLLAGVLESRIFILRSTMPFHDDMVLENPFYSLTIPELCIKLDLLAA